jgi:hypothetical protein
MRQFNHLKLIEGVLHRVTTVDEEEKLQLVIPLEHVILAGNRLSASASALFLPG